MEREGRYKMIIVEFVNWILILIKLALIYFLFVRKMR